MPKTASFAGPLANVSAPELSARSGSVFQGPTSEDPAVYGGTPTQVPVGTEIELLEDGGYKVVKKDTE